ncbi:hypothetical protein [Magnetospirillum sp. UT-4]|nr:hypothetical protein [Magnetospirillum sp. UT-4]CAA7627210.1 exported hypothetical protein [Magnetospirillum sp. UT-4]
MKKTLSALTLFLGLCLAGCAALPGGVPTQIIGDEMPVAALDGLG